MLMAPGKQEFSRRNRNGSGTAGAEHSGQIYSSAVPQSP